MLVFLLSLLVSGANAQVDRPVIMLAPLNQVFVPQGFDSNDNVEFVVYGELPNTCYGRHKVTTDVEGDTIHVTVTVMMQPEFNKACIDMIVPFSEVVTVGDLSTGEYKILVNEVGSRSLKGNINVQKANSTTRDEHIYARIDYIDLGFTQGASGTGTLVGWTPSDCLEFDRVEYINNGKDTLSILPIMRKVRDFCPMKMVPLIIPIKFDPSTFSSDKVLLMARSMDGKGIVNLMFKDQ